MKNYLKHTQTLDGYADIHETVRTLEKVSASVLREYKRSLKLTKQHLELLSETSARFSFLSDGSSNSQHRLRLVKNPSALAIIVTGDLGLTGDMWQRLYDTVTKTITATDTNLLVIGTRGAELWPKNEQNKGTDVSHISYSNVVPNETELNQLTTELLRDIDSGRYRTVTLTHLSSPELILTKQEVTTKTLYPLDSEADGLKTAQSETVGYPIIEGKLSQLSKMLYKKYIFSALHTASLETVYAEHAARTVKLEHAAVKTEELIVAEERSFRRQKRRYDTEHQLEQFAVTKQVQKV